MTRIPLWIDGEIAMASMVRALTDAGFHVHSDGKGRTVVDQVPQWLRHTEAEILPMKRRKRA